jgi:hypothetical protein
VSTLSSTVSCLPTGASRILSTAIYIVH